MVVEIGDSGCGVELMLDSTCALSAWSCHVDKLHHHVLEFQKVGGIVVSTTPKESGGEVDSGQDGGHATRCP
ncbi:hypothetical protein BDQ17DRAFT_1376730 [Cyathus striatus]|nr:hypothetical protein BDQ17DRAFT_1376730 [Cyathus striatus]